MVGQKVHKSIYCKKAVENKKTELAKPTGAKFENLKLSRNAIDANKNSSPFNGQKVHEARFCGKLKARVTRRSSSCVNHASVAEFENVQTFKYQESYVSLQHGDAKEIICQLVEGRQRFSDFSNIWKNKQLAAIFKCMLYRAFILSTVLYSSESWTNNKALEKKLDSFYLNCLRHMICFSYMTKITNQSVLNKTQMLAISKIIMIRRFKWFGHVQRMENNRLPRKAFEWNSSKHYPNAVKAVGGQRKT